MTDDSKSEGERMSEAKEPYKIGRPEEYDGEGGYVSQRLIGPGLGRWGSPEVSDLMDSDKELENLVCLANTAYAAGRASRDGLRAELDRLIYVVCEQDGGIIEELLKEDDRIGEAGK